MEHIFTTVADLYQKLSFIDSFIFFLYCLIGSGIYFFFRIYMPQRLKEREVELDNETQKMQLAEKAFQELDGMLKANTETIKDLGQTIMVLNQTFEKVSDKLYSHDEKATYMNQTLREVKDDLDVIRDNTPTAGTIGRIHDRIDNIAKDMATKSDVKLIVDKVDQIGQAVHEMNGKIHSH